MARMLIGLSFVELGFSDLKTQCLPYFNNSQQLPQKCSGFSIYYEFRSEKQMEPCELTIVFTQYISQK